MKKKNPLEYLLLPFSWIYGIVVLIRNLLFDLHILTGKEFSLPVISVGNITVGGTGKTPHVEYLISLLKKDFNVAVLSRGYMRKSRGFILADENSTAHFIGDEPCQIKSKFPQVHVAVDTNRVNGIQKLIDADQNIDLIILDDAFQHRYVKPGLSLLLIDYNRPLSGDALLPFGRLREPPSAIKRADIIIITKSPVNLKPAEQDNIISALKLSFPGSVFFTSVVKSELKAVFPGFNCPDFEKLSELKPAVLMLSGIANPESLRKYVDQISSDVKELVYPDHHFFRVKDVSRITDTFNSIPSEYKIILTSEKDAARLRGINSFPVEIRKNIYFISIKISFLNQEEEKFNKLILDYVRKNKRNRLIYIGENRD